MKLVTLQFGEQHKETFEFLYFVFTSSILWGFKLKGMRTPNLEVWFYYNTVTSVTKKFFIVIFPFLEVQHGVPHLFHPMGRGWWVPSHHHAPPFHRDPLNCEGTAVLSDTQLEQSQCGQNLQKNKVRKNYSFAFLKICFLFIYVFIYYICSNQNYCLSLSSKYKSVCTGPFVRKWARTSFNLSKDIPWHIIWWHFWRKMLKKCDIFHFYNIQFVLVKVQSLNKHCFHHHHHPYPHCHHHHDHHHEDDQ